MNLLSAVWIKTYTSIYVASLQTNASMFLKQFAFLLQFVSLTEQSQRFMNVRKQCIKSLKEPKSSYAKLSDWFLDTCDN